MTVWVRYSNSRKRRARIHRETCHHVAKREDGPSDWEEHRSADDAMRAARERGRTDVRSCEKCV